MPVQTKAMCRLCHRDYTKPGMTRHMPECLANHIEAFPEMEKRRDFTYLIVTVPAQPAYWLHMLMASAQNLDSLDDFLRHTWLECCGHMSEFFDGRGNEVDTGVKVEQALAPGLRLRYEYDLGRMTELAIRSVATYGVPVELIGTEDTALLARNYEPPIACCVCGKPAVKVCTVCSWKGAGWLCQACAEVHRKEHADGISSLLPLMNSPRSGVCVYKGQDFHF